MKLTFLGANHEVTGSCSYIECCGKKILVDYGMEQGIDVYENKPLPCAEIEIDYVLLTHAHIDHSGLLPLLCKNGFSGEIHSTVATANLCDIMLRDSAHIQEFEAEWRNRKGRRSGKQEYIPIYTLDDANAAIKSFRPHMYDEIFELCEGVKIRFTDAGHLLGSSSIEIWITENEETRKIVFSGDIGNLNQPLIRDPKYITEADYVVTESTYGDRIHEAPPNYEKALAKVFKDTFERGGSVIIPSFAVGRTQELLYYIRKIKNNKDITLPYFDVYVDSPLAIEATNIFVKNKDSCYDEEALSYVKQGINPISFEGLKISVTSDESRQINFNTKPKVIISASGMCEAGRIKHHLKHNLWNEKNTILFVGYQAKNTLGRSLLDGAKNVKLFGEEIAVSAQILNMPGMSGHADLNGLLTWINCFDKPKRVFVNHGDGQVVDIYANRLSELGFNVYAPYSGAEFDLISNEILVDAKGVQKVKRQSDNISPAYSKVLNALEKLTAAIKRSSGRTNKDLGKLASQLDEICTKWEE